LTTFVDFPHETRLPRKEKDYPLLRTINEAMEILKADEKNSGIFVS
jgi:hypothetical protein